MKMFRQGDVLLNEMVSFLDRIKWLNDKKNEFSHYGMIYKESKVKILVLARGEAYGHSHKIESKTLSLWTTIDIPKKLKSYVMPDSEVYEYIIELRKSAYLVHEEHESIEIPLGFYKIRKQREFINNQNISVRD